MDRKKENILGLILGASIIGIGLYTVYNGYTKFKSKIFKFNDLVNTSKTTIAEHPEQFNPKKNIIENANYLSGNLLDALYEISPYYISSWFRSNYVNEIVGGVEDSKHLSAEGVDIVPDIMFDSFLDILEQSNLPFTKAINEGDHIHLTLLRDKENLRQIIR